MKDDRWIKDPAKKVVDLMRGFINTSPENTLKNKENEKAWEEVLVGFSNGADPLYQQYKEYVGSFHRTPLEIFHEAFPEMEVQAGDLTIVSWVLPSTEATKADNRKEKLYPSERWVRARIFGEAFNAKLARYVAATLNEAGIKAVVPSQSPLWKTMPSDRYVFASTWSERHAAYASGLGTFGLCDGLITSKGKAIRCGSVIANVKIPPTERPYSHHRAYCLFFSKAGCGKCIPRCPAEALSAAGHDKVKCRAYVDETRKYVPAHFGFEGYGCGLCQTGVPCESEIPQPT